MKLPTRPYPAWDAYRQAIRTATTEFVPIAELGIRFQVKSAEVSGKEQQEVVMKTTWKPHTKHGELTDRSDLPDSVFAFPEHRKEPLTDASHVRNALARFDQVEGVSDDARAQAFANIKKAAEHFNVEVAETHWQQLGKEPHTRNSSQHDESHSKSKRAA